MRKSKGVQPLAPRGSRLSPSPSRIPKKIPSINVARSAEDIPRRVQLSGSTEFTPLRSMSPGSIQGSKMGVRYITEDLIKKTAKQENVALITTLNLTLSNDIGKKIKYIENLESLKQLQVLNLSGNCIEKIEKLEKLTQLQELNLSFNNIRKLEGMESLVGLQVLNLTGNQIKYIPSWLAKRLKSLRVFKIAKNNLGSLNELCRLKALPDLVQLSFADNPLSELTHSRAYVIFHIRTLEILDGQPISAMDRSKAKERFSMEEILNLEKTLESQEAKNQKLEEERNQFIKEQKQVETDCQNLKRKDQEISSRIKELEQELQTKNDLLKKKTKELHKACEKHYQLEQELAFYKIDAKFANLGDQPVADQTLDTDDNEPLVESPYIGKALFKPNQFAKEVQNSAKAQKAKLTSQPESDEVTNGRNFILQQKKEQAELDELLQEKQQEIESANESLEKLRESLGETEYKVKQAYEEFQRVSRLIPRQSPANEMKMMMRQTLADKMKYVNVLRNQAGVLEKEINKAENSVEENRDEMSSLKWQMQQLESKDPTYGEIYGEMIEKEQQIYEDNEVSQRLQEQLGDMLETIATETANIKDLEQQLQQDVQPAGPETEELRQEMGSVVTGLQTYLENVKNKNHKQMKHIEQLLSEREKLQDKVNDLTSLLNNVNQDDQLVHKLKKHVTKTEEALLEHQEFSGQLEKELELKEEEEKDLQEQLEEAILNIDDLKQELDDTERRAQAEIQSLEQQLIAEKENTLLSTKKAFVEVEKDRHFNQVIAELEKSKLMNNALKNELDENKKKFDRCINDYILPGELKKRMKNLSHSLKTGKSSIEPEDNRDFVGKIFQDLQKGLQDQMNRMKNEIDTGRQNEKKLIQQNQALTNKLDEAVKEIGQIKKKNNQQKEIAEAQLANNKEKKLLQEEIKQLRKASEEAKAQLKMEKQKAFEKRVVYASESSEHDTMNSEERRLFDELQAELIDFKAKMKDKEEFLNQQLADADAKVAYWQMENKKQQQFYQKELQKHQAENATHRTEQDTRSKLIAEDLKNARAMVNHLQDLLNRRQQQLVAEGGQANMSDQMIASQEEELGHLYNILETQREEIENLNGALDHLMHQNPEAMGPAYDDQLKRLQDKVGRLTKDIETQSSFVKGFPVSTSTNVSPVGDVERSRSIPGVLGTHHGPVISAEPSAISASKYNDYVSPLHPTNDGIAPANFQEGGSHVISPTDRTSRLTGGHSLLMHDSAGHPSSVKVSSQYPAATNQYVSPSSALYFRPLSNSENLTTGQASQPLVPSTFGNTREQSRPQGSVMVQPVSTLTLSKHSALPAESFYPNSVLLQQEISGTRNQVGTEPIHGPLTSHTSKVLEISPSLEGAHIAPPSQRDSNFSINPITQARTLPLSNVITTGLTPKKLISSRSQIQPSRNVPSLMGEKQVVPPEINHSGRPIGYQTSGEQPISYRVTYPPQIQAREPMPSNFHQETLQDNVLHRPVAETGYYYPVSTLPHGAQSVIGTSSAPVQIQSSSGPTLGTQMLQGPSLSQEPQSASHEPIGSQIFTRNSMGQSLQGPVLGQASPYRKSVAFQQPLVYYGPTPHHYPTNQIHAAPQNTFAPDPSVNVIPNPNSSQTYSPQVHLNKQSANLGQMTTGSYIRSNQPYAPPGSHPYQPEYVSAGYPVVPGSPVASSSPIDSPSSPVWTQRSSFGEQFSPIKAGFNLQPTLKRRTKENLAEDDRRLFCNVPEHHNLEDYLARMKDKMAWLKMKLKNQKQSKEVVTLNKGRKLICRLQDELEERRSELEGLDLAIERQKNNLKKMKIEESQLETERKIAKEELQYLKECNNRKIKRKYPFEQSFERQDFDDPLDSSFDEHVSICQQLRFQGEIKCLEKTLLKRQTQLKQVDLELKECKQDLKSTKMQAENAKSKYDDATYSLENTTQETMELERRANEVGVQVVTEAECLKSIQSEYRDMQRKKNRLEKVLNEINEVIRRKDAEYRDIDNRMKSLNLSYMQLQKDLAQMSHKERETTKSLLSSEELLLKKKSQINQLKEQSEYLGLQTEKADSQLKERRTELINIHQDLDQKKQELTNLLKDVHSEVSLKKRELKLHQEEVIKLESQKLELVTLIHNKKGELLQLSSEVERNQNVLSGLNTETTRQKEALRQITEQYKSNQSEVSILKMQQEKKVEVLEHTSRHLQKTKSEMDSISLETRHRKEELELLSQSVQKERHELNQLSTERLSLETQVQHLSDERNLLTDSNKKLDNQLNAMKKELSQLENKIRESKKSVDVMQDELQNKEKNIENCQNTRSELEKNLQDLYKSLKDEQEEFSSLQTLIQETESESKKLKQEVQQIHSEKSKAETILEELTSKIEKSQIQQQDECQQINVYQEKLKELSCNLEEKNYEMETISQHTCATAQELESLHTELKETKEHVHNLNNQVEPLQNSCLELEEIQREKKETEVEVKLLKEQKSSMEAHLEQIKKNIAELYEEPLLDKEKLLNLILNNKQEWRKEALKEKFLEEQDHLRFKLQQQMYHHVDVIEATRQQSEGFLHNLRHKLNILQDVFITSNTGSPVTNSTNVNNKISGNLHSPVINLYEKNSEQLVPAKEN